MSHTAAYGCCYSLCHIPTSKRQQDATDYMRGTQRGEEVLCLGSVVVRLCRPVIRFKPQAGVGTVRLITHMGGYDENHHPN